jgi:hypothetical protein
LRHDFIGAGQIGLNQGQPDNPDHILEIASADKIRNYRDTYHRNRHVACLQACMSTSGRMHGELLRLIFFLSKFQQTGGRLFCGPGLSAAQTRVFVTVAASSSSQTGAPLACVQAVALRGVAWGPRHRASLLLATCRPYDEHERKVV